MTDTKILNRMIDFAPSIIARYGKARARCIVSTAIGCDVLDHFGITADPFPVLVQIVNSAFVAAQRRGADPVTAIARGGHILTIDPDRHTDPDGWPGHLMIHVPRCQVLIDLDFQQFDRPRQSIHADAAEVLPWPTGTTSRTFQDPSGAQLLIEATTDFTFVRSGDWHDRSKRAAIVAEVIRAITKNRL